MILKTKAELGEILDCLVFRDGNKERVVAIQTLHTLQTDAVRECANTISDKAKAYDEEHGFTDPETGTREYPKGGDEYMMELEEQVEAILDTITEQPL